MEFNHIYTKEEFNAYGYRLHFNTVIDIVVNSFAAYIVLKHSTKAMWAYKYYILLTIVCAFLMDFHISFIFGPFMMLPSTILCGAGFICQVLGCDMFWGHYVQYGIMHITISCVGCSLVAGLFYQLASLNGNVEFFHSIKGIIIIALFAIFYPSPSYALLVAAHKYNETNEYVRINYNYAYELYSTTPSCHALILDFLGKLHYGVLAIQVVIVWTVGSIVALKIHRKLSAMKNMLSESTLKARRQLLVALCFQLTIPSMLIVFPLVLMLVCIIAGVKQINTISDIAMPVIAFHSLVNACSIMYIITPYRKAVIKLIKKLLRIKEKSTQIFIESSTKSYTVTSRRFTIATTRNVRLLELRSTVATITFSH